MLEIRTVVTSMPRGAHRAKETGAIQGKGRYCYQLGGAWVLKIEIERKLLKNFHTGFMKLMLEHKGDSTERKVLRTGLGSAFAWLGTKWACGKGRLFENGGLFESGRLSL